MTDETLWRLTSKPLRQLDLPTTCSQCMRRVLDSISSLNNSPNDELSLMSQIASASITCVPFAELQGREAVVALRCRNTSFRPPSTGLGWAKKRSWPFPGKRDVEVRASRGREVATSRLGRRHAPPFSKERALALEIGGGGGRNLGNMSGCHLSATVLCAFNSADIIRRVSDQFGL